jgi:hypothetical protein
MVPVTVCPATTGIAWGIPAKHTGAFVVEAIGAALEQLIVSVPVEGTAITVYWLVALPTAGITTSTAEIE